MELLAAPRIFVLALGTATPGLLHASGGAGILPLMILPGLRVGRTGAVAGSKRDLEFVELIPLGIGTIAIRNCQQFLHAGTGGQGRRWRRRIVHMGIIPK